LLTIHGRAPPGVPEIGPGDGVGIAVEVGITRPDPPAALAGHEELCPVDLAGAPLRAATGVRHVPPVAVPAAVDAEGVGVPLDHSETVRPAADTPGNVHGFEALRSHDLFMARIGTRPGGFGRKPSPTGTSWSVTTRIPRELEGLVRERAAAQGLSFSDVIGNAIAASFDRPPVIKPRPAEDDDQDELLAS